LNAADRRDRLIRILIIRGRVTLSELATELEVSERTVMRDVDALSITTPIFTVVGRYGGIYIDQHYIQNQPHLKDYELALLKKIIYEVEQTSVCSLNDEELQLLKDMVILYSAPCKGRMV